MEVTFNQDSLRAIRTMAPLIGETVGAAAMAGVLGAAGMKVEAAIIGTGALLAQSSSFPKKMRIRLLQTAVGFGICQSIFARIIGTDKLAKEITSSLKNQEKKIDILATAALPLLALSTVLATGLGASHTFLRLTEHLRLSPARLREARLLENRVTLSSVFRGAEAVATGALIYSIGRAALEDKEGAVGLLTTIGFLFAKNLVPFLPSTEQITPTAITAAGLFGTALWQLEGVEVGLMTSAAFLVSAFFSHAMTLHRSLEVRGNEEAVPRNMSQRIWTPMHTTCVAIGALLAGRNSLFSS